MEENVACGERRLCAVRVVGVGDTDDADVGWRLLDGRDWNGGLRPSVDAACEEEQRGSSEVVQGSWRSAMYE